MTQQMQTRQAVQNTAPQDPRINSPEVKVIFPSPEEVVTAPTSATQPVLPTTQSAQPTQQSTPTPEKGPAEKTEEHNCKVDLQQAIKQNLVAFIGMVLLAIGIGYLIGKSKP